MKVNTVYLYTINIEKKNTKSIAAVTQTQQQRQTLSTTNREAMGVIIDPASNAWILCVYFRVSNKRIFFQSLTHLTNRRICLNFYILPNPNYLKLTQRVQ